MACDRWRVWCVDLYVGQEARLRKGNEKGPRGFVPC